MPDCPHVYDLQSYVDEALPPGEAAEVAQHLMRCDDCAGRVAELERLRQFLTPRRLRPSEDLQERIVQRIRTALPVRQLSCDEALQMASAYLDDELNSLERQTLETHLFACEECYREYVMMRAGVQAMRATPAAVPEPSLKGRILAAVSQDAGAPEPVLGRITFRTSVWRRVIVPAAAIAAVFLMTFAVMQIKQRPGAPPENMVAAVPPQPSSSSTAPVDETTGSPPAPATVWDEPSSAQPSEAAASDLPTPAGGATPIAAAAASRDSSAATEPMTGVPAPPPASRRPAFSAEDTAPTRATDRPSEPEIARPVIEIEPPMVAMTTTPAPGRHPAGLVVGTPTVRPPNPSRIHPPRSMRMPSPAVAVARMPETGVTRSRPLASPAVSPDSVPAEPRMAAIPPLTRPAPRIPRPAPRAGELEETPARLTARSGWLPTTTGSSERLYASTGNLGDRSSTYRDPINKAADRERKMVGPADIVMNW